MSTVAAPVSSCAVLSTSRTCACTVTSSAVVGSSAMITSGWLAIAIAMTTRWRMPPENSCGYESIRAAAFGMPTRSSRSIARARAAALDSDLSCWRTVSAICTPIL